MRHFPLFAAILVACALPMSAGAQNPSSGVVPIPAGDPMLTIPNGARNFGMGWTGVADSYDPANMFYNPANLIATTGVAGNQSFAYFPNDITLWNTGLSAAQSFPFDGGTTFRLAGSIRYNRYENTEAVRNTFQNPTGEFTTREWYVNLALAGGVVTQNFEVAVGFALKPFHYDAIPPGDDGDEVAYDIGGRASGTIAAASGAKVTASAGISRLNSGDIKLNGFAGRLPEQTRFGVGLRVETPGIEGTETYLSKRKPLLTFATNFEGLKSEQLGGTGSDLGLLVGLELGLVDTAFLRFGLSDNAPIQMDEGTFGFGFKMTVRHLRVAVDYAIVPDFAFSNNLNSLGVSATWLP